MKEHYSQYDPEAMRKIQESIMSIVRSHSKGSGFLTHASKTGGIRALISRKKWEYFSILPKKKKYSKSLQEVIDAAKIIQRQWKAYLFKKVQARARRLRVKFFAVVGVLRLYHRVRMRRESAGVNRIEVDPDEEKGEEKFEEYQRRS